ncbi:PulJ/GspJ family protein [Janthinobacterium fluminis]|uniref:Prepilin-type N-terminal cleavage/methylation domain-containing protein n=1 Tax=Janthinobacterium fluminis TaxID=2987524 RepID=A0ABT5K625_9BURK|nr:prepilin-type N-terminal cleavage/methylation domain-containing protein [Janthinobacterium fluminis]MDC8760463.1 prepilin-type N-terminal cleavage/methylation domain-containing protein [Janthinobacterium fluminis]
MSGRRAHRRGFTLIELLVAISILAIVAVLGWRGLDGIVRARMTLTGQLEQTRGMQLAFAQMQSDCEQLAGAGAGVALLHGRRNLQAENDRLTLVRAVFAENEAAQLQVVSYRIKDGVLTRRESNGTRDLLVLDALWQAALSDSDSSTAAVQLQADVAGMSMRLWDGSGWSAPGSVPAAPAAPGPVGTAPAASSGLEVSLRLQSQQTDLIKIFLLGAV